MNKSNIFLLIWFVMFVMLIFSWLVLFDREEVIAPCVDGDGDINLEGIMCEKYIETFIGYEEGSKEYFISIFVYYLLLAILAFFLSYFIFLDLKGIWEI